MNKLISLICFATVVYIGTKMIETKPIDLISDLEKSEIFNFILILKIELFFLFFLILFYKEYSFERDRKSDPTDHLPWVEVYKRTLKKCKSLNACRTRLMIELSKLETNRQNNFAEKQSLRWG